MTIERATDTDGAFKDLTTSDASPAWNAGSETGDRGMLLFISFENGSTARTLNAMKYAGDSMTFIAGQTGGTSAYRERMELWALLDPATGTNDFEPTWSDTVSQDVVYKPVVCTGVDQVTGWGNTDINFSATTSAQPVENDLVFAANSMGFSAIVQNRGDSGPFEVYDGNTTEIYDDIMATGSSGLSFAMGERGPESSAATYKLGHLNSGKTSEWVQIAVELKEASSGGTTSVNSDVDLRWSMLEATTSDIDLRWSMVSAVLQDSDLRWSVLNSVLQDANLTWSILEAIISDNDLRWSVLNAVLQNTDLRWSILNTAQNDVDFKWSILEAISNDSDMRWSILNSVLQDADLRWDVQSALSAVQSDVNLQWGILHAITGDAELRWSVVNSVFADSDLRWNIFTSVLQDTDLRWSIIASAFNSVDLSWDLELNLGTVYNDITLAWSLLAEVYNTLTSQWNLLESITSDTDMRWNILNSIANELALNWDLRTAIQAGATLQWNIMAATQNEIQLRWRIDSETSFPDINGIITLHSTSSVFTVDSLTPKTTLH